MAQMYPQDRGENHSNLLGEKVAELVAADPQRESGACAGEHVIRRSILTHVRSLSRFLYSSL